MNIIVYIGLCDEPVNLTQPLSMCWLVKVTSEYHSLVVLDTTKDYVGRGVKFTLFNRCHCLLK